MSNRASIDIDCDGLSVSVSASEERMFFMDRAVETNKALLIVQLLEPQIRDLMNLSKDELMKRHLELLCR